MRLKWLTQIKHLTFVGCFQFRLILVYNAVENPFFTEVMGVEILEILDDNARKALTEKHKAHADIDIDEHFRKIFPTHIKFVIDKPYCLKVNIFADDYSQILIHSGINLNSPYHPLSEAIAHIKNNQNFLSQETPSGFLNGVAVQKYLEKLKRCPTKLQHCFIEMGDCFMLDGIQHRSGDNNITDGMHRLVAYGLATDMNENHFPIPIYFGNETNML